MPATREVIACEVVLEDGSVELQPAESIQGGPNFVS
jgi:hypothetical protein